ncbi:hypothetical protein [Aquamicrobium sp.]|uniref:hypothetical protein n=1 Tax=Aquamicrobium sp. TaxID=1872579 RepID=UPI00259042D0|nr:hypothetical protein [Aquamicrobium sp.]MCK9554131.1 hypothetical protein [Aquamicrobium sp.]
MSKTIFPVAVAYALPSTLAKFKFGEHQDAIWSIPVGTPKEKSVGLYDAESVEAYATARVREALEQAIAICDEAYEQARFEYHASCNPYFEGGGDAAESIESKIRALIPPLPGPAEP